MAVLVGRYVRFIGSRWELGVAFALAVGQGCFFVFVVDGEVPIESGSSTGGADRQHPGPVRVTGGGFGVSGTGAWCYFP